MSAQVKSNKNLRKFLQGVQLHVRIYGIRVNIYTQKNPVIINRVIQPNFLFDVDSLNIAVNCINDNVQERLIVNQQLSLKHVMIIETSRQRGRGGPQRRMIRNDDGSDNFSHL